MKTILLICLICSASIGYAADDIQSMRNKTLTKLQSNHRSAEINLGEYVSGRVSKQYPGYEINAYCEGSFKNEGGSEYLLGIVDPISGEGEYVVLFEDVSTRIAKFSLAPTWQESLPDVKCFSYMGAKRLDSTIKNSESISGQINPLNHFDVACVAPYHSHNAYTCYSYSIKNRSFLGVGGWTN